MHQPQVKLATAVTTAISARGHLANMIKKLVEKRATSALVHSVI